jgi:hypothetical protein
MTLSSFEIPTVAAQISSSTRDDTNQQDGWMGWPSNQSNANESFDSERELWKRRSR